MRQQKWLNKNSKDLFRALALIENPEVMAKFCRDLMTEPELEALSGRWQVAQLLSKGFPQREVSQKTKVSIATVTRVNQWLERGMGGYKKVLDLLNDNQNNSHHKTDLAVT
ncbi:transposase [Candidatus Dojkabacteria bacterium]|nr:transposase [Candidatus Dojkabacteria bacterium]